MIDAAIFLCDVTGRAAEPWAAAGYRCYCVDIQHSIRKDRVEGNIHFVWGDVRSWAPPQGIRPIFGVSFTDCTNVAGSGARDFEKKRGYLLRDALEHFEAARQCFEWAGIPYMQENSVGVLSSVPHIGTPAHYFEPWEFSGFEPDDYYTKKTCVWPGNGFVMPEPNFDRERYTRGLEQMAERKRRKDPDYPTPDYPDNRIHFASPGDERANFRSASPRGFFRAVFEANRPDRKRANPTAAPSCSTASNCYA